MQRCVACSAAAAAASPASQPSIQIFRLAVGFSSSASVTGVQHVFASPSNGVHSSMAFIPRTLVSPVTFHRPPASTTMRPAAAAFTAFLSRRGSSFTSSSSGILSPHVSSVTSSCARLAFGGTSRRNMTVYSFSHRNSLARGALSVSNANSNGNSGGSVDVSSSRGSSRGTAGPASKIPRTPQKKRAFSSTSLSASASSSRTCSTRGTRAVKLLPVYLTDARAVDRYCPDTCPDGALQLSVAENQMLEDLLVPAVRDFASASSTEEEDKQTFYADMIYYQPTPGRPSLRRAMADYLQRILSLPGSLDAEGMVVGAGCNAVLENLCICLAEPGEGVLIPTPYYAAFEFDLVARAGLDIVPVPTMAHHPEVAIDNNKDAIPPQAYYPNRSALDAAVEASRARGVEPKILLLSHPNNPLGVCYPPSVVRECIEWGRENEIHIVSDEIYAGSVYRESATITDGPTFKSALSIAAGQQSDSKGDGLGIGPYVHFVYALSKDFCLSGLRVGAAYSENPDIRLPMQKLNDLCQISSQTQLLVEKMLSAPSQGGEEGYWSTDDFLPEARRRMKARCEKLESCLNEAGIPHLTSDSGMFVWMDMREFLPPREDGDGSSAESQASIDKRERTLYLELLQKYGLLFTPGRSMKNELPGFFRCVFTAASDHEFDLGLERISKFANEKRGA